VLTHSVARELRARGHEVSVFTGYPERELMSDAKRFDKYEVDGIPVYRFHHGFVPMGGQQVVSEIEYNNHLTASYFKGSSTSEAGYRSLLSFLSSRGGTR